MTSNTLVIARYNEPLTWLVNVNTPFVIYNKGSEIKQPHKVLENIGRESHTYLTYILENYNDLPTRIAFCQGNPFPHCINFLNFLKMSQDLEESNKDIIWFCDRFITEYPDYKGSFSEEGTGVKDTMPKLGIPYKVGPLTLCPGAQFSVHKDNILSKPYDWWIKCLEVHNSNPRSPWIYERIWQYIFDYSCK